MKVRIILFLNYYLILIFLNSCKEEEVLMNPNIFSALPNTQWIYVSNFSDTLRWEYVQTENVKGQYLAKIGITDVITNYHYYSQLGNEVLKHGSVLPKTSPISFQGYVTPNNNSRDTLVFFSSPSREFVLNQEIGYEWSRKIFQFVRDEYQELEIKMTVIAKENITTPAGNFDCDVFQDEFGRIFYVSEKGMIKTEAVLSTNDTTFTYTQELVSMN